MTTAGRGGRAVRIVGILVLAGSMLAGAGPARAQGGAILRYAVEPRVVDAASPQTVVFSVVTETGADAASIRLRDGTVVPLSPSGPGSFTGSLSGAQAVAGYDVGDIQNFVGSIKTYSGTTEIDSEGVELNVRDETMPDVAIDAVGTEAQRSAHIVNLRYDTLYDATGSAEPIMQRFYQDFPDDFDFAAIVSQEQFEVGFAGRYEGVRNDVQGLGSSLYDAGAGYGSAARLEGVLLYPGDGGFDLGAYLTLHELSHRWGNFSNFAPLAMGAGAHWPLSDVATGVLGMGTGYFPFHLVPDGSNYRLERGGSTGFNDLELYQWGLVPAEAVGEHFVFDNQSQPSANEGVVWTGPVTRFGIQDVIAVDGPRRPDASTAQKDFRIVAIVLSRGRLLTPTEMAYFDHAAARAGARAPFTVRTSSTDPFFVATGGRGTLSSATGSIAPPVVSSFSPAGGGPGTIVEIEGSSLIEAAEVRIGSTSVGFTVGSESRLTATVPAGSTPSGPVTVVTPHGSATSAATFNGSDQPPGGDPPGEDPPGEDPPGEEPVLEHPRSITLSLARAGKLRARGGVTVDSGYAPCSSGVRVRLLRRTRSGWKTLARTTTDPTGAYSIRGLRAKRGRYKAVAPTTALSDAVCLKATARARA